MGSSVSSLSSGFVGSLTVNSSSPFERAARNVARRAGDKRDNEIRLGHHPRPLYRRVRRHRQRDDDVDFVRRLVLRDALAAWRLNRDGARDRETNVGIRIGDKPTCLDQLVQVRTDLGQVASRLREFPHGNAGTLQPLRHGGHLIRAVSGAAVASQVWIREGGFSPRACIGASFWASAARSVGTS